MNLADNLKKIRKEHNLSQEQLAEKLNVSRQSVSKWESNQAYPEMDKMVQLCKLFNLNMDDLLNQDISEVNNNKQAKNSINKFIDDFLKYVTKTIDLFSNMKFKTKIKCLFEQCVIIGILILIFSIVGIIGSNIVYNILSFLPDGVYYPLYNLFEGVYLIACIVLGIALVFHIFKIRYLDYYEVVNTNEIKDSSDNKNNIELKESNIDDKKVFIDEHKEKIIIRDPKHSEYKFINSILKGLIFIIKLFVSLIGMIFSTLLCALVFSLVMSFVVVKTGMLFIGLIVCIISFIIINYIILRIIYNFVFSYKSKKIMLFSMFIVSLIGIGIGSGFMVLGLSQFNYVKDFKHSSFIKDTHEIEMNDKLVINNWYGYKVNYIESNQENIKIEIIHNDFYDFYLEKDNNVYSIYYYQDDTLIMNLVRTIIKDINNKNIINYSNFEINIYASKDNIEIIKNNNDKYWNNTY